MQAAITDALRTAVEAIAQRAKAANLSKVPLDEYTYSWWRHDATSKELQTAMGSELSLHNLFSVISPGHEPLPEIAILQELARNFERQAGWEHHFLFSAGKLLRHYFSRIGRQLTVVDAAISETVAAYLRALTTKPYVVLTTVLWTDFSAEHAFELNPSIHFRPIEERDYQEFSRETEPIYARFAARPVPSSRDWICEIRQKQDRKGYGAPHELIADLVAAVGLSATGKAEAFLIGTSLESEFLRGGQMYSPRALSTLRLGDPVFLSHQTVKDFTSTFALLSTIQETDTLAYLRVPLRRFRASTTRMSDEDVLVDFVIALESLLAPDSQALEVTHRFRLRGAAILNNEGFGDAAARLRFFSELYRARSRAVHGEPVENLRDLTIRAELALKNIFMWFARHPRSHEGARAIVDEVDTTMAAAIHQAVPPPNSA